MVFRPGCLGCDDDDDQYVWRYIPSILVYTSPLLYSMTHIFKAQILYNKNKKLQQESSMTSIIKSLPQRCRMMLGMMIIILACGVEAIAPLTKFDSKGQIPQSDAAAKAVAKGFPVLALSGMHDDDGSYLILIAPW